MLTPTHYIEKALLFIQCDGFLNEHVALFLKRINGLCCMLRYFIH